MKKTRKYDIITTPAERVEMAPLNEEDDEDEDSTVFDIKYRYGGWRGAAASSWALRCWGGGMVHTHLGKQRKARCGVHVSLFFGYVFDLGVFCLWGEPL